MRETHPDQRASLSRRPNAICQTRCADQHHPGTIDQPHAGGVLRGGQRKDHTPDIARTCREIDLPDQLNVRLTTAGS